MVTKTEIPKEKQFKKDVQDVPESLKTAYEVHTLAHMLYGHLSGPRTFGTAPMLTHAGPAGFEPHRPTPFATGFPTTPTAMPGNPLHGLWIH